MSVKKKEAIGFIAVIFFFISLFVLKSHDDIGIAVLNHQSQKEIVSLCKELGLENVNTAITKRDEKYFFCYWIKVTANGQFDETSPQFFDFFDEVEKIEDEYFYKACALKTPTRSLRSEFIFNGNKYKEIDGIIYCNGDSVNFKTTDIRIKNEYKYKEPQIGMPSEALRYTKYGYYRYSVATEEYYWQVGDYKIYAKLSEDTKDFGDFSDFYVTDIRKVYSPPPTKSYSTTKNHTTTKKYYVPSYNKDPDYDPYDAKNYADAEGFYYDHYDDFWDYEEAEEYFNEHSD